MERLYSEIVTSLENKIPVALATVINRVGSAPRAVGAKFLVKEDGTSFGSIGGGCVEAEVWQGAQDVIKKGQGGLLHFSLTAEQLASGGLICGGNVDIFLEPLVEEFLDIYRETAKIKQKGGSAILVTLVSLNDAVSGGERSKVLIKPSGEKIGTFSNLEAVEQRVHEEGTLSLRENKPRLVTVSLGTKKMELLIEPVLSEPTVFIFGGGHVSEQIAPLAKKVNFKVVVTDDREMFANRERFPEADEVIVSEFENCFSLLTIDESSYLVIVTRGHLYDAFVLEQAIKTNARYIGMIGSKKKIQTLYRNLIKQGIPKETFDRVHAPIGIDIHSETPEEIGVSVVAQLIQVRGAPLP
jgi:xanthine dehydrogenase accessory factor